ncbi:DNA polymerase III subunit beta [Alsobacter metallidurans]|uniref:Beta sliding clamp n=1 Tax=Alsobacter metallidurans TaxID=340221 RepID=A0A917MHE7_9HYPH|nr:DNA polymerase III subunit beta [Alsobacter metallidurans]GGH14390.1 DNA polymerase III subunit beta [Alsobacter metallidurans]
MKFSVSCDHLLAAMRASDAIVEKKTTIPILSNVLLEAEGEHVAITGTDLDLQLGYKIPAEVEKPGKVTIPHDALKRLLGGVPKGATVRIETADEGQITIQSGRSRYKLQTLPAEDFPNLTFEKGAASFPLDENAMAHLFGRTSFAMSTEETRYYLNGVFLHPVTNANGVTCLRGVTTDGHRLAQATVEMPEGGELPAGVIVPRKTVGVISSLFVKGATVRVSETKIQFAWADVVLTSKLIDGSFPDYQRVCPALDPDAALLTLSRNEVISALTRLTAIAKSSSAIRVDITALTASIRDVDSGSGTEELEGELTRALTVGEGKHAADYFGVNASYLREMLAQFTTEHVSLQMIDPGSPLRLVPVGVSPDYVGVLMPMRA